MTRMKQQRYVVAWTQKNERAASAYHRIERIGLRLASYATANVIGYIEAGDAEFFVQRGDTEHDLQVATASDGRKYLRSSADKDILGLLLTLPGAWEYHDADSGSPWSSNRAAGGGKRE